MRVFLTGASGILGTDIKAEIEKHADDVLGFDSKSIRIGDYTDVKRKVADFEPDVIIHSAAMTNVDLCEDDNNAALLANVIGTHNLSLAASERNIPIVYISSCGVYGNGKTTAYNELDATNPVNYHHYTKLEGERKIKEHNSKFIIIRPGWLFGGTREHRKNFVEARKREAANNLNMVSANDKVGSPTYTLDLAKQLITLLNANVYGTFNVVNEGAASRYDYVLQVIKELGLQNKVEPVSSANFPRKAPMPDNEVLENMNLNLRGLNQMRPWKEALHDYIETVYTT